MEAVVKRIVSAKLGPKWKQLYSRLNLGPRDRYRIETAHNAVSNLEERYNCCVRDTVERWESKFATGIDESKAIKQLLCALEMVQGFEDVARDIASANGVSLHPSPELWSDEELDSDTPRSKLADPLQTVSSINNEPSSAFEMSQLHQWPGPSRAVVVDVNHADMRKQYSVGMIDLQNRVHKYSILDVCQRLPDDVWEEFASALGLSSVTIKKLNMEAAVEERYYLAIKTWLNGSNSRTFPELQDLLFKFNCVDAVTEMKKRLASTINTGAEY